MAWKWRDYEGVISRLVPKTEIKGIIKQDIIVGPGEEVVIIRNGKIEDSVTQTRLEKIGGGFGNWFTRNFGVGEDVELLFIDTKEMDLEIPIKEISSDHDEVTGTCTLRMRIDPTQSTKLIGLMKERPLWIKEWKKKGIIRKRWEVDEWYAGNAMVLLKDDFQEKIEDELKAKVLSPCITKYPSKEIRGNPEIREAMERAIQIELRKTLTMWGLNLLNFYTTLEAGAYEELETYRREKDLEMERTDIDFMPTLRELDREHEERTKIMEHAFEEKRMGILHDEDIKDILQEKNLDRQRDLLDFKEDERSSTLGIEWQEHIQDMKELFGDEYVKKYGVPGVLDIKERMNQWKKAREEHEVEMKIKEFQATELAKIKEKEETEREKARMEAEKAKYGLEAYERAIEKERERQKEIVGESAKLMQAAKQELPHTLVQGAQPTPVVSIKEEVKEKGKMDEMGVCPHCGEAIKKEWKVCPYCGEKLKE
jgi:hypothetical protein